MAPTGAQLALTELALSLLAQRRRRHRQRPAAPHHLTRSPHLTSHLTPHLTQYSVRAEVPRGDAERSSVKAT